MCCHCKWCTSGRALCTWNLLVNIHQSSSGAARCTGPAHAGHAPSASELRPLVVLWMLGALGILHTYMYECASCPCYKHGGCK